MSLCLADSFTLDTSIVWSALIIVVAHSEVPRTSKVWLMSSHLIILHPSRLAPLAQWLHSPVRKVNSIYYHIFTSHGKWYWIKWEQTSFMIIWRTIIVFRRQLFFAWFSVSPTTLAKSQTTFSSQLVFFFSSECPEYSINVYYFLFIWLWIEEAISTKLMKW